MTEFETQNIVDVVVDDRSLTEARADVEGALSEVPIDVQAEVSGGGGGEIAARDRARQRQILTNQTESLDELREQLDETDIMAEWQEEHALSRERNRLLEKMIETQEEGDFDRAKRLGGGLGAAAGGAIGAVSLLGVGALANLLTSFSWPDLPGLPDWPDPPQPPAPPEPEWHPLQVEPVTEPIPVEDPREQPVEDPKEQPVADPREQPVEDPKTQPVEDPAWAPVEVPEPSWLPQLSVAGTTEAIGDRVGTGGLVAGGVLGALGFEGVRQLALRSSSGASAASGGAFLTPEGLGMTDFSRANRARSGVNRFLDDRGVPEQYRVSMLDESNERPGSVFSAEGRQAQADALRDIATRIKDAVSNLQTSDDQPQRNNINVESNVSVDGATRREVERAAEDAKQKALQEFDRKISRKR